MSETVQVVGQHEASPDVVVAKLNEAAEAAAVGHVAATGAFEPDQAENDEPAEQSQATDAMLKDPVKAYLKEISRVPLLTAADEVELAKRTEAGLFAGYKLEQADAGETELSETERAELEWIAADGEQAKDHLISANLRLVVSLAKRYTGKGMPFLDIIQEGNLGMIRAVEKFDYAKGYKFSTYATWWIKQAIHRGFADRGRTIRLPVHVVEVVNKINRIERKLSVELDREPTIDEIAAECKMDPEKVEELMILTRQPVSLETPIGEDGRATLGSLIEDSDEISPDDIAEFNDTREKVRQALAYLPEREGSILDKRFGIYSGRQHTLEEIGQSMGMTRERVRQLEAKALSKLKPGGSLHNLVSGLEELAS